MDFASTVKELRKRCLLSQMDFAKEIGVSFSTVNRWETGKTVPNFKTMRESVHFVKTTILILISWIAFGRQENNACCIAL